MQPATLTDRAYRIVKTCCVVRLFLRASACGSGSFVMRPCEGRWQRTRHPRAKSCRASSHRRPDQCADDGQRVRTVTAPPGRPASSPPHDRRIADRSANDGRISPGNEPPPTRRCRFKTVMWMSVSFRALSHEWPVLKRAGCAAIHAPHRNSRSCSARRIVPQCLRKARERRLVGAEARASGCAAHRLHHDFFPIMIPPAARRAACRRSRRSDARRSRHSSEASAPRPDRTASCPPARRCRVVNERNAPRLRSGHKIAGRHAMHEAGDPEVACVDLQSAAVCAVIASS